MQLKDLSGPVRVVLRPVGYQFESVVGDDWDDNWLIIAGDVASGEAEWSFRDPSLVIDEATPSGQLRPGATNSPYFRDAEV